eukprot:m.432250 g.432250  ORF g.432250 m.432250 type:complete len:52 (+) comp17404_c0_seq1:3901-4056(+)
MYAETATLPAPQATTPIRTILSSVVRSMFNSTQSIRNAEGQSFYAAIVATA